MADNIKSLLAKCWKNEPVDLEPGRHFFDEVLMVRVSGTVEKQAEQLVAPTVSIPLILTLALFWEKCGVTRDRALQMLRTGSRERHPQSRSKPRRPRVCDATQRRRHNHTRSLCRDGRRQSLRVVRRSDRMTPARRSVSSFPSTLENWTGRSIS